MTIESMTNALGVHFARRRRAFVSSIRTGSSDSGTTWGNSGAEGMGNEQSPGYSHSMMLWGHLRHCQGANPPNALPKACLLAAGCSTKQTRIKPLQQRGGFGVFARGVSAQSQQRALRSSLLGRRCPPPPKSKSKVKKQAACLS